MRNRSKAAPRGLETPLFALALAACLAQRALGQGQVYSLGPGVSLGGAASPLPVVQASAGHTHSVLVRRDGSVQCIGSNAAGESSVPSSIRAVSQAAAGWGHTVVLRRDGAVMAWGSNSSGQIDVPSVIAPPVSGGLAMPAVQVAAGGAHSAAVLADGRVIAWGENADGRSSGAASCSGVRQVSCGRDHTLVLGTNGTVQAFGGNYGEDLCQGWYTGQIDVPSGLAGVTQVAAGGWHSLALTAAGQVLAWGSNGGFQKGCYFTGQSIVPESLSGRVVTSIAAGARHSLALIDDGTVVAWGADGMPIGTMFGNSWQPLGQATVPVGLGAVTALSAGSRHSIAVLANGGIVTWGGDDRGQRSVPVAPAALLHLSAGHGHACGVAADGQVFAWGQNYQSTNWAGDVPTMQGTVPVGLAGVQQVACGFDHTVALMTGGTVQCWGANSVPKARYPVSPSGGQCTPPDGLTGVVAVGAGDYHSIACRSNGTVVCWGLGLVNTPGSTFDAGQSIVPSGLSGVVQVAGGALHTVARRSNGTVAAWGSTAYGQSAPPSGLSGVTRIAGGVNHSLALKSNGRVVGWGSNSDGLCLGNQGASAGYAPITGNATGQEVVIDGAVLTGVTDIAAAGFSAALLSNGEVRTWGTDWIRTGGSALGDDARKLSGVTAIAASSGGSLLVVMNSTVSGCTSGASSAVAPGLASSGGFWRDLRTWNWGTGSGGSLIGSPRLPGASTPVSLVGSGSVVSDCSAVAGTFTMDSGSSLVLTAAALSTGADHSVRVSTTANLSGRLWVLGAGAPGATLPEGLDAPVLSAGTVNGSFALLQTELPPPPGMFVTVVPESVAGRTVLSLRLLPLPGSPELSALRVGAFSGRAVAAEAIDIDHDGFDDLALAIDFGPGQPGLVQILMNDGLGNLGARTSVLAPVPAQPTCLAVGNLSADDRPDVVVGTASDSSAHVLLDDGQGGLVAGAVIGVAGGTPTAVVVVPQQESIVATAGWIVVATSGNQLRFFTSSGAVAQLTLTLAGQASAATIGNLGGSRGKGIATGGTTSNSVDGFLPLPTGFMQTILRHPDGVFRIAQTFSLTAKPVSIDAADLDGDGWDDIVTANADPQLGDVGGALPVLSIFRNASGTFGGGVPYQPANASSGLSVTLIDADEDGDRDIVSVYRTVGTDSEAALLRVDTLGAGTPISIGQTTVLDASDPILSARGNLDGVGGEDLFLVNQPGDNALMPGAQVVKPFLSGPGAVRGDLDRDGRIDTADLALMLMDFGACAGCPSDLDGSGSVDFADVALLLVLFG